MSDATTPSDDPSDFPEAPPASAERGVGAEASGAADPLDPLEDLIGRLERAAEQLRSGELSTDAAATLVDECAALANRAGAELERRSRAQEWAGPDQPPGQDSLL
ncbi:MAG TPA: hypothetical protein VNY52_01175 [Solirubrobacteraceae bacterium]|jgi:hypothetical protein|nr:hypothetical protein [Solirubrobacteraceae bacterium]